MKKREKLQEEASEKNRLEHQRQVRKLEMHGKYNYKKEYSDRPGFIGQTFSLYAAEVVRGKIKLDEHEHSTYEWLDFDDALERLTWKNQKRCLELVNSSLEYKNFRRIVRKNGILILGGKDEDSNDDLVEQSKPDEYVLHTVAAGSPFVNIKGDADKEDIKEAAIFCAKYSRDWKEHKKDIEVNLFKRRDMYKGSGMNAGTWGVKKFETIKVKRRDIEDLMRQLGIEPCSNCILLLFMEKRLKS